ncbi:MAG: NAD-dependent malic enzyme [Deltaproteobacteria bacterium]|nr:NAD-dependent malic enzyme [Deltaproteobacteria bacterium]
MPALKTGNKKYRLLSRIPGIRALLEKSPVEDIGNHELLYGTALLHNPYLNKGIAFTEDERQFFGLKGLLPPAVLTLEQQVVRLIENVRAQSSDINRYITMMSLYDRNITMFFRALIDYIEELMPIVYTPTVGKACQMYGQIYQRPRGIFISENDRGNIAEILRNWPYRDLSIIVVTDGERILGLGDLGANGMGIPVGKLALYTACAGIEPTSGLAVTLDVGTENRALLNDSLYIGVRQGRLKGKPYDDLVEEFITAVKEVFPCTLIQFEDFAVNNAIRFLKEYRKRVLMFNDDIQGTAAVALAGLFSAMRITGGELKNQRLLFLGAGEAGTGIADLVVYAMANEGLAPEEGRKRCWFVDSRGLVIKSRGDLAEHKRPYAHDHTDIHNLLDAVKRLSPTVLIGVSGQAGAFTRDVIKAMSEINDKPVIFALSNPTSKAECTAEEAYKWSDYKAVFASGSPFGPVEGIGRTFVPGQGNNVYIFPGVGLGAIISKARHVTDEMFLAAAKTLAGQVSDEDLSIGRLYPSLKRVRDVSVAIAESVAEVAYEGGLAQAERPDDLIGFIRSRMYDPVYRSYIEAI